MSKPKPTPLDMAAQFATLAWEAGLARKAMTTARRQARDRGVAGTTAREVVTKRKFQDAQRKLWALADRIDWATAMQEAAREQQN